MVWEGKRNVIATNTYAITCRKGEGEGMAHFQVTVIRQYPCMGGVNLACMHACMDWGQFPLSPMHLWTMDTPSVSCMELSTFKTLKCHTVELKKTVQVFAQKPSDILVK